MLGVGLKGPKKFVAFDSLVDAIKIYELAKVEKKEITTFYY